MPEYRVRYAFQKPESLHENPCTSGYFGLDVNRWNHDGLFRRWGVTAAQLLARALPANTTRCSNSVNNDSPLRLGRLVAYYFFQLGP